MRTVQDCPAPSNWSSRFRTLVKYCCIRWTDLLPAHRPPQLSRYLKGGALVPRGRTSGWVRDQGTRNLCFLAHRCSRVFTGVHGCSQAKHPRRAPKKRWRAPDTHKAHQAKRRVVATEAQAIVNMSAQPSRSHRARAIPRRLLDGCFVRIRTNLSKSNIVLLNTLNGEAAPMTYCLPLCSAIVWPCPNPNPSSGRQSWLRTTNRL